EIDSLAKKGVRFRVLGNTSRLSPELLAAIRQAEKKTEPAPGKEPLLTLVVFFSYSGKWDILQAAKKMAKEYSNDPQGLENVKTEDFSRYLVTAGIPDPDLIIRTSGEERLSNYLLWQAAYSEFLFVDTLWPDFRRDEFMAAIEEYSHRNRRYGKVK
ncbi:MAG TPA: di-trans,poly-cis-decaprenylcistransferase, partial [Rikenellaceae bacterium]|nr:di-trans,poly-cis-decaprenylcistransferase [Rikenellaceae bacterium]